MFHSLWLFLCFQVPPSESLRCVNASIVGLGVTSVDKDTEDNRDGSRSSLPLCLGLGKLISLY